MKNISRRKIKSKDKIPEVARFIEFLNANNMRAADLAASIDTAERTITNHIWSNTPLGGQLLRELLVVHGVSADWLLSGRGSMYVRDNELNEDSGSYSAVRGEKRLIEQKQYIDNESLPDVYLIFASTIEQSLIDAGAEAENDYTYLDLYKLAQAHVIEEAKKTSLKVQIITPSDRN